MPEFTSDYAPCRDLLLKRLREPAPGRIQLLTGPRQVGKTTLLLEIAAQFGEAAVYAAGDEPDAALPGFWERRRSIVITAPGDEPLASRHGLLAISWKQFLLDGPPQR
jgi:hypothetical protein